MCLRRIMKKKKMESERRDRELNKKEKGRDELSGDDEE